MNTKNMTDEKNYVDADGNPFLPDPKREILLAAILIQEFINRACDPENLSDMDLETIRQNAIRIVGEVEAIRSKRG